MTHSQRNDERLDTLQQHTFEYFWSQTDPATGLILDNTAPGAAVNDPGAYLCATVSLTANASDAGSGVATVAFERSPAGAGGLARPPEPVLALASRHARQSRRSAPPAPAAVSAPSPARSSRKA